MHIGIDIGGTLTKMVYASDESDDGLEYVTNNDHRDGPVVGEEHIDLLLKGLDQADMSPDSIDGIGVTGVGADLCLKVARRYPDLRIATPDGDPITRELRTQVAGLRRLAETQNAPLPDAFLLMGIGTGTSYTFVDGDVIRPYTLGNSIGGGTLLRYASLSDLESDDASTFDDHSDIQMDDVFPHFRGTLMAEFVMSSGGKLGGNPAASISKIVMTQLARDILSFGNMPDWQVKGPIVPIGSPIEAFPVFRYRVEKTLKMMEALGVQHRMVDNASFAGAAGAYLFASDNM